MKFVNMLASKGNLKNLLVIAVLALPLSCGTQTVGEVRQERASRDGLALGEEAWRWARGNKGKVAIIAGIVAVPILLNASKNFFVFSNPMVEAG